MDFLNFDIIILGFISMQQFDFDCSTVWPTLPSVLMDKIPNLTLESPLIVTKCFVIWNLMLEGPLILSLVLCLVKFCRGVSSELFLCLLFPFIDQTAKTKVINSCLNPVWNEELTFSMKEPLGVLKLVCSLFYNLSVVGS